MDVHALIRSSPEMSSDSKYAPIHQLLSQGLGTRLRVHVTVQASPLLCRTAGEIDRVPSCLFSGGASQFFMGAKERERVLDVCFCIQDSLSCSSFLPTLEIVKQERVLDMCFAFLHF